MPESRTHELLTCAMTEKLAIVLAAGKGTRMNSPLPKVLIEVCGRPMLDYVLGALRRGGIDRIVLVVGHREELVRAALADQPDVGFVPQCQQLGTGHAVMTCRHVLELHRGPVVVVTGDAPLMQDTSIAALLAEYQRDPAGCVLGTLTADDPTGMGRILRSDEGKFIGIVEEKDATAQQRCIREVNRSCYVFDPRHLLHALEQIGNRNAQHEYYLTDCLGVMVQQGIAVRALNLLKPCEALGVNTPQELAEVEAVLRKNASYARAA